VLGTNSRCKSFGDPVIGIDPSGHKNDNWFEKKLGHLGNFLGKIMPESKNRKSKTDIPKVFANRLLG
jgi:hypothetical protein